LLDEIARKGEAIILIDAVNQIQGGLEMLLWLPEKLPGGLKLIVSLKKDAASERLLHTFVAAEKNVTIETLPPFEKREERERLIHDFLGRYFKALDDRHIDTICNLPYADNPLFLNILLHELRVFGTFRQLDRQIGRYGETPQEAFEAMLGRLESDPAYDVIAPEASVPFLFGLLAHARRGLSENELASCFAGKFPDAGGLKIRGTIRFYLRQVRPFMAQREGRTDFFYESFLLAARAKYAKEAARLQKALSDCFLSFCDPLKNGSFASGNGRALTEYAYHLMACDECEGERLYENIPYLTARCSHTAIAALLEEYGRLGDTAQRKAQEYRQAIFRYAQLLSAYPDALPSLLYLSGTDDVKAKLLQAQEEGKIKSPWLKADLLPVVPAAREEAGESGLYCRVVAEHEFTGTSAVTIAQQADLAFYSLGRGKIGVADTASLVPYGTIIPVSAKSIVSLRASDDGTFLVAGFEDGTAEAVKLTLSDAGLMAKAVHTFSYLLPYGDTGIFVFESNEALWYQGVNGCLNRLPLSGDEAVSEAVSLPVDGDITSLCIGSGGVCYSVWRKGGSVLFVLSPIDCRLLSRREFTGDDVVVMGVSGTFFVAASMQQHPDYGVYLLDANLNAVHRAGLPSPVAACCEYGSGLFIIPRTHVSKTAFLWDYDAGALSTAAQPFNYQSQLFVKANRDHTLTLISHLTLTRFDLQTGRKPEAVAHSMEVINKGTRVHILKEKIRERRFPVDRGLIKDMCYSPATGKAYIFFEHPPDGIFSSDQFVTYGTIEDFLNEREKHAALHCSAWSPNRFAALAEGDDLLILSDGIITVHALDGLRYKTALSAEEPIRQMGKDESGGEVFALIGESKTTKLTIIN
ncbi:MAG: hypothetical protein LBQ78_08335, partial [Tannerellaceae bacterium]|nr:hypothetical protein [Tannerellaceae bacterium]